MTKEVTLALIRHLLTGVGGYLIAKGIISEEMLLDLIGGLMSVLGVVWSLFQKREQQVAQRTAYNDGLTGREIGQ